jgi:hypothetical protein
MRYLKFDIRKIVEKKSMLYVAVLSGFSDVTCVYGRYVLLPMYRRQKTGPHPVQGTYPGPLTW